MSKTEDHSQLERFREMAKAHQEKHGCTWSQACLAIKRKHPESRASFGAPPEGYMDKIKG